MISRVRSTRRRGELEKAAAPRTAVSSSPRPDVYAGFPRWLDYWRRDEGSAKGVVGSAGETLRGTGKPAA